MYPEIKLIGIIYINYHKTEMVCIYSPTGETIHYLDYTYEQIFKKYLKEPFSTIQNKIECFESLESFKKNSLNLFNSLDSFDSKFIVNWFNYSKDWVPKESNESKELRDSKDSSEINKSK